MTNMNVLSLFNGCGMLRPALDNAGFAVANYYASEIDPYAIKIADKNYQDTIQLGDITDWRKWDLKNMPKIDLLVAGFPCQDLSRSGHGEGLSGERSGLLFKALTIHKKVKPKYFIYENVASMNKNHKNEISRLIGVNPIKLNSKYWGAQNRERLFWTNIPGAIEIERNQIRNDKNIYLYDILLSGEADVLKSYCISSNYSNGSSLQNYFDKKRRQLVFETAKVIKNCNPSKQGSRIYSTEGNKELVYRKLHPVECERLFNLPDDYTKGVSNTQRYKMLGNGFDVAIITDLLKCITDPPVITQPELFANYPTRI